MLTFADLIHTFLDDLGLTKASQSVQKIFGFRLAELVDEQIEEALVDTLTDEDWKTYEDYRTQHPNAPSDQALATMLMSRPQIREVIEKQLMALREDILLKAEAVDEMIEASKSDI